MKGLMLQSSWISAALLLLTQLPHRGSATYSVFIARSELERYYRGTPDEASILGFSVDIIRDGVSLVLEDGSLALIPSSESPTPSINSTIPVIGATTSELPTTEHSSTVLDVAMTSTASPEISIRLSTDVLTRVTSEVPNGTSTEVPVGVSSAEVPNGSTEVPAAVSSAEVPTVFSTESLMRGSTKVLTVVSTEVRAQVSTEVLTSTEVPTETPSIVSTTAPLAQVSSSTRVPSEVSTSVPSVTSSSRVPELSTDIVANTPTLSLEPTTSSIMPTVLPTPSSTTGASTTIPPSTEIPVTPGSGSGSGIGSGIGSDMEFGQDSPPGSLRKRRSVTLTSLPPLPSHIDEVAFSWFANTTVNYELTLSMAPMAHFSKLDLNISSNGTIPLDQSDFSVTFPCSPNMSGLGVLFINLTTIVPSTSSVGIEPDDIMVTTFKIQKNCQAASFSPVLSATVLDSSGLVPTSSLFLSSPLTTPTPTATPPVMIHNTASPPPGKPVAESQFVTLLLLVFAPVVGVLVLSILLICCALCICCCCCRKRSKSHYSDDPSELPMNALTRDDFLYPMPLDIEEKKDEVPISLWMALPWGSVANLPAGVQGVIKRYSVDRRSLSILATVSRGDFGCIVNGQLSLDRTDPVGGSRGVMMKLYIGFQKQYGHRDEISKFLECGTLLRGIDHPNIHSATRVSIEDNYVPIITYPIMEYGNLHQFLTLCRVTPADSPLSPVTIQYKMSFAFQIASGMKHLSEKGIIHPDLALRNCYLDTNYQAKISDGALSQCFYPECYNTVRGTVRPVRWAAIETLQEGLCTSQSNVWSYGVTLWEVMTLAKLPYCTELDHDRCVATHLLMDNRLAQPEDCPDNMYSLMLDCWKKRAEGRPNFSTVHAAVFEIHSKHAVVQSTTSAIVNDATYSTFGKKIRPQISITETPAGYPNQRRRRSSVVKLSRDNSTVSQRNSKYLGQDTPTQNHHLGLDAPSQDEVSLSFSVLSDENYLNQASDSEDELEGTEINIPMFLTGNSDEDLSQLSRQPDLSQLSWQPAATERPREEYPVESVSTFLPVSKVRQPTIDNTDFPYGTSSFQPGPPPQRRPSQPLLRAVETVSPLASRSQCTTPVDPSRRDNEASNPRPLSDSARPDPINVPGLAVQSDVDTVSKASTLDSVGTFVSGPQSNQLSSHIPGIPGSTYNSTSVTIDDVKLRNKSLLSANGQTSVSAVSATPSGTSKSDSGIRSDEEVDLVLSSGCPPPPPVAPKGASIGNRLPSGVRGSLGLGDFSKDLMSTFASWDDK